MEPFTNSRIDTHSLPKFEAVQYEPLHPDYKKVILFNMAVFTIILFALFGGFLFFNPEPLPGNIMIFIIAGMVALVLLTTVLSLLSFSKKGFAFRQHDVLFKSGVIGTTITIIPYNRVQHVALHQGVISGRLGLAAIEVFTAGGGESDIRIPGIEKDHAENIKQLLMSRLITDTNKTSVDNTGETPIITSEDEI